MESLSEFGLWSGEEILETLSQYEGWTRKHFFFARFCRKSAAIEKIISQSGTSGNYNKQVEKPRRRASGSESEELWELYSWKMDETMNILGLVLGKKAKFSISDDIFSTNILYGIGT